MFTTPFKVEANVQSIKTPDNYRLFFGGDKLPNQVATWAVQTTGTKGPGVVSDIWGFADSPDAEVLTAGVNRHAKSGAVAVGRHGSVLQWGFSGSPTNMTEAGRNFFLNCVVYIRKFHGMSSLVRATAPPRENAIQAVMMAQARKGPPPNIFSQALASKFKGLDEMLKYLTDHIEIVYFDKTFAVDEELQTLGLDTNRSPATLEKLVGLLKDEKNSATATKLLKRYTLETFDKPEDWQAWLEKNRSHIYFSDVGGYKFRVVPKGYLEAPASKP